VAHKGAHSLLHLFYDAVRDIGQARSGQNQNVRRVKLLTSDCLFTRELQQRCSRNHGFTDAHKCLCMQQSPEKKMS